MIKIAEMIDKIAFIGTEGYSGRSVEVQADHG